MMTLSRETIDVTANALVCTSSCFLFNALMTAGDSDKHFVSVLVEINFATS